MLRTKFSPNRWNPALNLSLKREHNISATIPLLRARRITEADEVDIYDFHPTDRKYKLSMSGEWVNEGAEIFYVKVRYDQMGYRVNSEIVSNGDFESGTIGWYTVNCTITTVGGGVSGNALQLTTAAAAATYIYQTPKSLTKDKFYKLSFWVKGEDGSIGRTARASFYRSGETEYFTKTVTITGDWQKVDLVVKNNNTTQANYAVYLYYYTNAIGQVVYFDDVSLRELQGNHAIQGTISYQPGLTWVDDIPTIKFDGVNDYLTVGNIGDIKSIFAVINPVTTTQSIIDLNGTNTIDISSGTLRANNMTNAELFVNGVSGSSVSASVKSSIALNFDTVAASAAVIGKISSSYFNGDMPAITVFNKRLSLNEIKRLHAYAIL